MELRSNVVKIMVFRQLLKARENYILDFCSEIYICVCVFICLNMLSFLLIEGKGIGTFRS